MPKNALDTVLWLESDRMGHFAGAITQAKLDEQRGVVQNEKRQGENQPYGKVWEIMLPQVFPPLHPYSWETIGSMAGPRGRQRGGRAQLVQDLVRPEQRRAGDRRRRRTPKTLSPRVRNSSATFRPARR